MDQAAVTSPGDGSDFAGYHAYLLHECGKDFADWLLGTESRILQDDESSILDAVVRPLAEREFELFSSSSFKLAPLLWYEPVGQDTRINLIQRRLNPSFQPEFVDSGDEVVDSLRSLATRVYGEMLLHVRGGIFQSDYAGPEVHRAIQAIAEDPELPFDAESLDSDTVPLCSTTQYGETSLLRLPSIIIGSAMNSLIFAGDAPSLPSLLESVKSKVSDVRTVYRKEPIELKVLSSLTGVSLNSCSELRAPGISVRSTRPSDHPTWLYDAFESSRVEGALSPRDLLGPPVVRDIGVAVLETSFMARGTFSNALTVSQGHSAEDEAELGFEQLQLAAILALGSGCPRLIRVWTRVDDVLTQYPSFWHRPIDPLKYSPPVELTSEQQGSWQEWLERIAQTDMQSLGVAPRRLISAWSSQVLEEKLVDAVIVLEALCGGHPETVFRVKTATARLLERGFEKRKETVTRLNRIYEARSRIVHGAEPTSNVDSLVQEAFEYARRALVTLIKERIDLLGYEAQERCNRILLE